MVLDGIFVLVLNMGTYGAALATIICQGVSVLIYALILFKVLVYIFINQYLFWML